MMVWCGGGGVFAICTRFDLRRVVGSGLVWVDSIEHGSIAFGTGMISS